MQKKLQINWGYKSMETLETLQKRRSIRKFTEETVSKQDVDTLLHAAMSGPSACNFQPWEFYVVKDEKLIAKLRQASQYTNIVAPMAIVVAGNLTRCFKDKLSEFWVQDCSAATENILLAAADIGLGTVWCGIYPKDDCVGNVRKVLNLPENEIPLNIIWIGHPKQMADARDQYNEKYVHILSITHD